MSLSEPRKAVDGDVVTITRDGSKGLEVITGLYYSKGSYHFVLTEDNREIIFDHEPHIVKIHREGTL